MGGATPDFYDPGSAPTVIPPPRPDTDPTKTQEAAIPRVPPPTPQQPPTPIPQASPPSPGDFRPAPAPYTPIPRDPPAPPVPRLGDWDHEDEHPDWLRPHITPRRGPLPNRVPDGYSQGQPVYNLRPGEDGYGGGNLLSGIVAQVESGGGKYAAYQPPSILDKTFGQKAGFIAQYGVGPPGINNYARQMLRANPNATLGDFYAGYTLGTGDPAHPPTLDDLRTRYPAAYDNLVKNLPRPGQGSAQPGTPSGPQGVWTQENLQANFAERTGQLGQPGRVPLTVVKSPNGQSWQVNTRAAPQFEGFLNDLYKAGYTGMVSSGGYANRPVTGGTIPSEHAYGAAIDIGATANPLQYVSAGGALKTDLPPNIGEIAAKWGLKWGGTFRDRQDPMHFEVAALMTPEQLQAARSGQVTTSGGAVTPAAFNGRNLSLDTPLASLLGGAVAGPPQQYIPPQPRPPHQWGETPTHDWTPGRMPQAHDIPSILGGLLPLLVGFAGGKGLGAITAFSAYQNARNKGQLGAARDAKESWKGHLEETTDRLKEEMLGARGIVSQYGWDLSSPEAMGRWQSLAANFEDQQLQAAVANSDGKAVERLMTARDQAFQTMSKTSAAAEKADKQAEEEKKDEETLGGMGFPAQEGEKPAAPARPPAGPAGWVTPDSGAEPYRLPATGGPAGVPEPGSGGRPTPAAPAPPPQETTPPAEAAPPTPQAPGAAPDGQPAPAPAPQPAAAPTRPQTPFEEMVSELVNGTSIDALKGVPKAGLPQLQAAAARKIAQINAVPAGPHAADQIRALDPTFGDYARGVANYSLPAPTMRGTAGREYANNVYAAAQKINPGWTFQNYDRQKEFSDYKGNVQVRLTRASTMGRSAAHVLQDLKILQESGETPDKISEALDRASQNLSGDRRYTNLVTDLQAFTQEDQALRAGTPSVTETEQQLGQVVGKIFVGTPEQIRGYIQQNIDTASSAIDHYREQWKLMQGYGPMPGTDTDANGIIAAMPYLDPVSGQYPNLPKDVPLPASLQAGVPHTAPPPPPTGGSSGWTITPVQ